MNDFRKTGLSVEEVAQILHCTPNTVRVYINQGKLEALMSSDHVEAGRRRTIRITKEQLKKFMREHQSRFSHYTLEAWGVIPSSAPVSDEPAEPVTPKVPYLIPKKQEEVRHEPKPQRAAHFGYEDKRPREEPQHCKVVVDGKVLIGDCSRRSAGNIVNSLLNDPFYKTTTITIEVS